MRQSLVPEQSCPCWNWNMLKSTKDIWIAHWGEVAYANNVRFINLFLTQSILIVLRKFMVLGTHSNPPSFFPLSMLAITNTVLGAISEILVTAAIYVFWATVHVRSQASLSDLLVSPESTILSEISSNSVNMRQRSVFNYFVWCDHSCDLEERCLPYVP